MTDIWQLKQWPALRRLQTETQAGLDVFTPALLAQAFRGEL